MPFKNKIKAKEYFTEYNQKRAKTNKEAMEALKEKQFKERKCDLCNYKYAQVLITTEQNEIHLCPNHLIALVMRDLEKQDAVKLREKYGKDITWLDDEIYADDGTALQPA